MVLLVFDERLDVFEGDIADAGDEVASRPERGKAGLQFRELFAQDMGGVGLDLADDGADAEVRGDLDAEVDMVAHDFGGIELVAEFLLLVFEKLGEAFIHAVGEDFPPVFGAENDVVLAAVADVVDVLVLFGLIDDVHGVCALLNFGHTLNKTNEKQVMYFKLNAKKKKSNQKNKKIVSLGW